MLMPVLSSRSVPRRRIATLDASKTASPKPYYVTTPIFYVNACAHS